MKIRVRPCLGSRHNGLLRKQGALASLMAEGPFDHTFSVYAEDASSRSRNWTRTS